ncbi:hypothetical protein HDU76_001482 [Blyttiomyces sp. JEL0837]|nr:hypothetical protein HDU76_001482 [Blyttiomyces sp. JEL0837]
MAFFKRHLSTYESVMKRKAVQALNKKDTANALSYAWIMSRDSDYRGAITGYHNAKFGLGNNVTAIQAQVEN